LGGAGCIITVNEEYEEYKEYEERSQVRRRQPSSVPPGAWILDSGS
jgi:hypothetical protein